MPLTPLQLYILLHIKKAGVEYAKMIMKMTEVDLKNIQEAIDSLMSMGLLERDSGSAIKRTRARFKRASEVHKHHTYYRLSRRGILEVRKIDERYLQNYFDMLLGKEGFKAIKLLAKERDFDEICSVLLDCEEMRKKLVKYGFMTESGRKTRFFMRFAEFASL